MQAPNAESSVDPGLEEEEEEEEQYYRMPLPASCIDFTSEEGKVLFTEALPSGYMNCFFKLCSQFRTQDEPAYCGLTSLVMTLNALQIDPGKIWKDAWRWYDETMLDKSLDLKLASTQGISMEQFIYLATFNNLKIVTKYASDIASLGKFRALVKKVCAQDEIILICSFHRGPLGQFGTGHFSPIAGYHEGQDKVLILDTARYKYPPHWAKLSSLLDAMNTIETDSGKARGYCLLSRTDLKDDTLFEFMDQKAKQSIEIEEHDSVCDDIERQLEELKTKAMNQYEALHCKSMSAPDQATRAKLNKQKQKLLDVFSDFAKSDPFPSLKSGLNLGANHAPQATAIINGIMGSTIPGQFSRISPSSPYSRCTSTKN